MSSNLKDLVEKNIEENNTLLKRGNKKSKNQRIKEKNLIKKVKKGFKCLALLSALSTAIYVSYQGFQIYEEDFSNNRIHEEVYDKVEDLYVNGLDYMIDAWVESSTTEKVAVCTGGVILYYLKKKYKKK